MLKFPYSSTFFSTSLCTFPPNSFTFVHLLTTLLQKHFYTPHICSVVVNPFWYHTHPTLPRTLYILRTASSRAFRESDFVSLSQLGSLEALYQEGDLEMYGRQWH